MTMKFLAHLGVIDEVELIERCVDHLWAIGVDQIVVFDMGSTDGTREVLERLEGPDLRLVRLRNDLSWDAWNQAALDTVRTSDADWVLFLDADEFWIPASGSLRDWPALDDADVVTVHRYNVVLAEDGLRLPVSFNSQALDELLMYSKPFADFRDHLLRNPDTPWIRGVPVPKVIGRRERIGSIEMGMHEIDTHEGSRLRRIEASDVVIAHAPFSTFERFERRIRNLEEFFALHTEYFSGHQGWHWRRWHEVAVEGRVEEEFERQVVSQSELDRLRLEGMVRSAADLLSTGLQAVEQRA